MNKRFLAVHHFLEKMMLIEFGCVCILSLLAAICTTCILTIGITYLLSGLLILLMATTALCFSTGTIWMIHYMNEQINMFMKVYEKFLEEHNKERNSDLL